MAPHELTALDTARRRLAPLSPTERRTRLTSLYREVQRIPIPLDRFLAWNVLLDLVVEYRADQGNDDNAKTQD